MQFSVKINCENAAFSDDWQSEVARILDGLATKLAAGDLGYHESGNLWDANGNRVGKWIVS